MSKRVRSLATVAITLFITSGLVALAAGKRVDVPVRATLADAANGSSLRVGSDGMGDYVTTSQVSTLIQALPSGSDWMFYTYYSPRPRAYAASNRGVRIDLSEQITAGAFPTPIASPTVMPAHLKVHCSAMNIDMIQIPAGQSVECPASFRFWAPDGLWYRMAFTKANYPEVDQVVVRCEASASNGCQRWTIRPAGTALTGSDPNPKNYGRLLKIDAEGFVVAVGGNYYVSFAFTIAR
jgi:hypothetical protein